ncbi:MAG: peptide chain release factor N(5)-glutamine methyltransferase [Candidatus Omnitrophica bacterium]|nr:peptide chain release factor N(5)-glutamine methyltransferase [Candidatus Omnitrophota bacterium]
MSQAAAMDARSAMAQAVSALAQAGAASPQAEAEWMLSELLGCSRTELYLADERVTPDLEVRLAGWVARRAGGEPLQYILGATEFFGHRLSLSAGVFVPRPETEVLVARAVAYLRDVVRSRPGGECRVLEVGTGSGGIAISLAQSVSACRVVAIELSWNALCTAAANVAGHGLGHRISLVQADGTDALRGSVELLISNPPYVPSDEIAALSTGDPRLSLDGGTDGMVVHRRLLADAPRLLAPGGALCLECAEGQADRLRAAALASPWAASAEVLEDFNSRPRGVWVRALS